MRFVNEVNCLCAFAFRSRLKLFFQTGESYWLETNKFPLDVLFIYSIWWIHSLAVVQYLLPNTVLDAFHIGLVVRMSILDTEVDGSNPSISMFSP